MKIPVTSEGESSYLLAVFENRYRDIKSLIKM